MIFSHFRQVISKFSQTMVDSSTWYLATCTCSNFQCSSNWWIYFKMTGYFKQIILIFSPTMLDKFNLRWFLAVSQDGHFKTMVDRLQWFLPSCDWSTLKFALPCLEVATAPIVGSNDPKPDPIYASLRLAFHPKCAWSARKCIAQYRLKFHIIHCQFFSGSAPVSRPWRNWDYLI